MMASLSQRNLKNAVQGLFLRDDDFCNDSIADDEEIDLLEMQVDQEGIEVMSRYQPVALELQLREEPIRYSTLMFDDAVLSFAERNASLALGLKARDKELDRLSRELTNVFITRMQDDPINLEGYLNLIFISRSLERIGDHAANIAEDVVFAIRAEDIRHGVKSE